MPLAFHSLSHGKIAFGFFNIETDLLLLNRYFFFAADFCHLILEVAKDGPGGKSEWILSGYLLAEEKIGDLMGAIHGYKFEGFIGEVYRLYPFPRNPEDFRQNPEGFRNRSILERLVVPYGSAAEIPVRFSAARNEVAIGAYHFSQENFHELLGYVWLGGYPRWRDGRRPAYVEAFKDPLAKADGFPFEGIEATLGSPAPD